MRALLLPRFRLPLRSPAGRIDGVVFFAVGHACGDSDGAGNAIARLAFEACGFSATVVVNEFHNPLPSALRRADYFIGR